MRELKFHKESECQRLATPSGGDMYSGRFKFATQNTAVYDKYCFVENSSEVMKIYVECDRAFARKGQLAILRNSKLEVFENNQLVKTIPVGRSSNIRDFLVNFEEDLEKVEDSSDVFIVDSKEMVVDEERILFGGREYPNGIHEPGCRYFVAWSGKVAVLGNSKSFSFVYFYDGEMAEAEEYSPLSVRTDEESLDSVPLVDMKFWKGRLLLIDEDVVSVFSIAGFPKAPEADKVVAEYNIKNGMLVRSEVSSMVLDEEPVKLLEPGNGLLLEAHPGSKASGIGGVGSLQSALGSLPGTSTERADDEIEKLDAEFMQRMEAVKRSFSGLRKKRVEPRCMVLIPSKFDFEGLYSLIFHCHIREYEDALSNMILRVENLQTISESSVLASIKYFDSKISQRGTARVPAKYQSPLCVELGASLKVSSPLGDLLEGIRVLGVHEQSTPAKPESGNIQSGGGRDTQSGSEPASKAPGQGPATSSGQNRHMDNGLSGTDSGMPADAGQRVTLASDPGRHASAGFDTPDSRVPKAANAPSISIPFGANIKDSGGLATPASQQGAPLFSNAQQSINSDLFVRDTSSLFSNIASSSLHVPNTHVEDVSTAPDPSQSNAGSAPVSAFNRLAGSRRLFK